jgi:hypothetical protein
MEFPTHLSVASEKIVEIQVESSVLHLLPSPNSSQRRFPLCIYISDDRIELQTKETPKRGSCTNQIPLIA